MLSMAGLTGEISAYLLPSLEDDRRTNSDEKSDKLFQLALIRRPIIKSPTKF